MLMPFTIRTHEAVPSRNTIRSRFQYRTVLDEDRLLRPGPGRFSCFRLSTLLLEMLFHFDAVGILDINSSSRLVLLLHQV